MYNYNTKARFVLLALAFVNIFLSIIAIDALPWLPAKDHDIKYYDIKYYKVLLNTEYREHTESKVYYVIPIAGPYEIRGILFMVDPCPNVSIDWSRATVSKVPFYIYGMEVEAVYIGEAAFYTNDISINHYDGGSGRIYKVNNTLWFTPLISRDGSLPPDRGKIVFRIREPVNIVYHELAKLVILYVRDFGNPKVKESLTSAGIVDGAIFNLEPMPIANYEIISVSKAGEGIIISEENPSLNNTKVTLYIVTTDDIKKHGLDKMMEGYKPIYKIFLGGTSSLPVDVFVFIIANASYMRAWRLVPVSYTTTQTQPTTHISLSLTSTSSPTSITTSTSTSITITSTTSITATQNTTTDQQSAELPIQTLILIIMFIIIIIVVIALAKLRIFVKSI